jgi:hypothetical protein
MSVALLCAWCGTQMREGPRQPALVSHGICAACLERLLSEPPPAEEEAAASGDA